MVGAGQTVDIGKMAVLEPDLLRLLVHQLDKGFLAPGEAFGEDEAGIVAGLDDHAFQQIVDFDAPADRHEHFRSLQPPGPLADRQFVVELGAPLLQHVEDDIGGHDLAHRGRRHALVGGFVEQHRPGLDLDDKGVLRLCFHAGGRVRRSLGGGGWPWALAWPRAPAAGWPLSPAASKTAAITAAIERAIKTLPIFRSAIFAHSLFRTENASRPNEDPSRRLCGNQPRAMLSARYPTAVAK